jgi:threonine synthase
MKYVSTRDDNESGAKSLFSLEDALCAGYAPDGGLFVPSELPKYNSIDTPHLLKEWSTLSTYKELLCAVLAPFVCSEIPAPELAAIICDYALTNFETTETIPIVQLSNSGGRSTAVIAELFHGPTYCFKDFGLRVVVGMLAYFAQKRNRPISLVAATTGDTGPAAVRAVQDLDADQKANLAIVVHFPKGQISEFQRRQLTTVDSPNVKIVAFEGSGDDMDVPIKNIMTKSKGVDDGSGDKGEGDDKDRTICGINSYNIGRPLVQMVHFVSAFIFACLFSVSLFQK